MSGSEHASPPPAAPGLLALAELEQADGKGGRADRGGGASLGVGDGRDERLQVEQVLGVGWDDEDDNRPRRHLADVCGGGGGD